MPERRTHDYAAPGVTSLFAAFNTADGTVIEPDRIAGTALSSSRSSSSHRPAVPAELDVHLVCDNLATHKTPP